MDSVGYLEYLADSWPTDLCDTKAKHQDWDSGLCGEDFFVKKKKNLLDFFCANFDCANEGEA